METPTLSELERAVLALMYRIRNITPSTQIEQAPPSGGNIVPAGSIIYCRPSNLRNMIRRLGEKNVQIVDTQDTVGFTVSKTYTPVPWDRHIYPRNIGPSVPGIDMTDGVPDKIPVRVVSDSITPTAWKPLKPLTDQGGGSLEGVVPGMPWADGWNTVSRVLWISTETTQDTYYNHPGRSLYYTYIMGHPRSGQKPSPGTFKPYQDFDVYCNQPRPPAAPPGIWSTVSDMKWCNPDLTKVDEVTGGLYRPFDRNELYMIFDDTQGGQTTMTWLDGAKSTGQVVPDVINLMYVHSNELQDASRTPLVTYGGYAGGEGGTGPTPRWSRTYLVQIKILNDVRVE